MLPQDHLAAMADGALPQGGAREVRVLVARVLWRRGDRRRLVPRGHAEERAAAGHLLGAVAVAEEAVVANALEAVGQAMEEKPPDEFLGGEGHRFLLAAIAVVGPLKADLSAVDVLEAVVRDRHAVGVAPDVVEHLLRARKGPLRVDHPVGLPRRLEMRGKARRGRQGVQGSGEVQPARVERVLEIAEEQPAEEAREHPDGEKERRAASDPAGAIEGEPPPGTTQWRCG